jgi:hypothetical protein
MHTRLLLSLRIVYERPATLQQLGCIHGSPMEEVHVGQGGVYSSKKKLCGAKICVLEKKGGSAAVPHVWCEGLRSAHERDFFSLLVL